MKSKLYAIFAAKGNRMIDEMSEKEFDDYNSLLAENIIRETGKSLADELNNADGESHQVEQAVSGDNDGKLSPEQIQNWRRVLCGMLGPYALIAPDEQIQALRDRFQQQIDKTESH